MTRSKITLIGAIILLIVIGGQFFYYKHEMSALRFENADLKEEKKVELKKARDSAFVKIEKLTLESDRKFDSILSIPPTIKWKKYEKPIYIDRTLDDALRIHSEHKADIRAKKENF